jgi:DNA replication protein DnaC
VNFCNNFGKKYENLYIYGPAGVGKTHLTSCIVGELVNRGFGVIYQTAYKLFEFLEDCKFGRSKIHNADVIKNAIYDCDLLIIDDFGTEFITSYTQTVLFDLINTRLLEKKPTIINSNLNLRDVSATYTDRISSRIMGEYTLLRFVGQDIRLLKKQREE